MTTVLAALDATAAARPVLETALCLGDLFAAKVEVVHVREGQIETPRALAERAAVPFRLLDGPVVTALLADLDRPEVSAAVIGARGTTGGRRPVGRTALQVLEQARKPVVVVAPDVDPPRCLHRLLIPLEGTDASSSPVLEALWPLIAAEVELVVLHVFTAGTLPKMLDRPEYDLELLGKEFLARHCPHAARIELLPGPVGTRVAEMARKHGVDLVVLSWSQTSAGGRAEVVREVLGASAVPVLLLPTTS